MHLQDAHYKNEYNVEERERERERKVQSQVFHAFVCLVQGYTINRRCALKGNETFCGFSDCYYTPVQIKAFSLLYSIL